MPLCRVKDLMIMFGSVQRPADHSTTSRKRLSVLAPMRESKAYGTRLGEAGLNAYDIAKLMGPCEYFNESALRSQFAIWRRRGSHTKKNQRRHSTTGPTLSAGYIDHLFTKGCNLGSGGDIHGSSPAQFVAGLPQTLLTLRRSKMGFSCSFR
jgi:hypothetical protein